MALDWKNEGAFPERKGLEIQLLFGRFSESGIEA